MPTGNAKALREIELMFEAAIERADQVFKDAAKEMATRAVDRTPIWFKHEPLAGNMMANWSATEGRASSFYDPSIQDLSGLETLNRLSSEIQRIRIDGDTTITISNTGPAGKLEAIEFGRYPVPSRGSWNTRTKRREIRSVNGFSTQAPGGIIGVLEQQWNDVVEDALSKTRF